MDVKGDTEDQFVEESCPAGGIPGSWSFFQAQQRDLLDVYLGWSLDSIDRANDRTYASFHLSASNFDFAGSDWALYYNQLSGTPSAVSGVNVEFEHITGDYFVMRPTKGVKVEAGKVVIPVIYNGIIDRVSDAPKGPYIVAGGWVVAPVDEYIVRGFDNPALDHQDPEGLFQENAIVFLPKDSVTWIPRPASFAWGDDTLVISSELRVWSDEPFQNEQGYLVETLQQYFSGAVTNAPSREEATIVMELDESISDDEGYKLEVDSNRISIKASGRAGIFYAIQSLRRLLPAECFMAKCKTITVRGCAVEDAPRFKYRGLHFDVSRNFHSKETVKRLIDLMAFYKLNKLHLTLTNDEGWRIEIPGLPELTEVGSRRGHTKDEHAMLYPAYGSGPKPDGATSSGTGYYTRDDFIEILQHADSRHIEVIPEIDMPGHARAAIKSMMARRRALQLSNNPAAAEEFLLHDDEDASTYTSAQRYSDNVMCVCRESAYSFIEKVLQEVKLMYEAAGLEFRSFHMGGDELPYGAWARSPICNKLISAEPSLEDAGGLPGYFLERILNIADELNVGVNAWEEATLELDERGHNTTSINQTLIGKISLLTFGIRSGAGVVRIWPTSLQTMDMKSSCAIRWPCISTWRTTATQWSRV